MGFFENLAGFIVQPYKQTQKYLQDLQNSSSRSLSSFLFVIYGAIFCGIIFVFWVLYPERLYYPVPYINFHEYDFIELSTPIILFVVFLGGFLFVAAIYFVAVGLGNYIIMTLFSKKKMSKKGCREYLGVHGFSISPLLFLGIFTILWIYFFEKLYISYTFPPFIDFTVPTIIFFVILFIFLAWQWLMELRINQSFFETSVIRAIIPELVQMVLLWGFLASIPITVSLFGTY